VSTPSISTVHGIAGADRRRAAELYDEAFGAKLGLAIKDRDQRLNLLSQGFQLSQAITAVDGKYLVGLAGWLV